MMQRIAVVLLCSLAVSSAVVAATPESLEVIRAEADLEKQSKFAVRFARATVKDMEDAYREGRPEEGQELLNDILAAVRLSQNALDETGKNARKRPKHFKRAEIATRKLVRDLKGVQRRLPFEERQDLAPVIEELEEINRELLLEIMQSK